jgi:two-component system, NtrC family, sensor histidine kinase HydH
VEPLSYELWTTLIACVGHLMLAVVVIWRGGRGPLVMPLALLCLDFFAWNAASLAYGVSGDATWHTLDMTFSPLTPPLGLWLVLAFVGRLRSWRWVLLGSVVGFGTLSAIALAGFVVPWAYELSARGHWGTLYLLGLLAMMGLCLGLLVAHLRRTGRPREQARTRLILAALLLGVALGATAFLDDMYPLPDLASFGSLVVTTLLAIVVLRLRLLGRDLSASSGLYALSLAALANWGFLLVIGYVATSLATALVGMAVVTLAVAVAVRELVGTTLVRRERRQQLEEMGRMSAQMAHDLKNPLAALKGAVEFLLEERARGRSIDEQSAFLELMRGQVGRLGGVIEAYQRLSQQPQPIRAEVDLNALVREVLSAQAFAGSKRVRLEATLAERLPPAQLDRELVTSALENIVKNAFEAMPKGGTLRVRTSAFGPESGSAGVLVEIEDDGVGMDARKRERAFDSFFTTKPEGTGLGLAQVRRVIEAHDGEVTLSSHVGKGTVVRLRFPEHPPQRRETA